MKPADQGSPSVLPGERGRPLVARALSVQARVSNLLAIGLMLTIGIVFLGWYYLQMTGRATRERRTAQAGMQEKVRAEMPLPPLGPIELPAAVGATPASATSVTGASPVTPMTWLPPQPFPNAQTPPEQAQQASTPQPTAQERRLSGAAFVTADVPAAQAAEPTPPGAATAASTSTAASSPTGAGGRDGPPGEDLPALLSSETTRTAYARTLPSQRLLLPKGAFIDCTLETAIDSTLPGITTCLTATDTFSADGKVVLLERGTKLIGETRGQVQQASTRVFVLWTEARTPTGVVVPLDSPGADELGRSGLPGQVDRHFWQRFGAATLISLLDGGVQVATQSASHGSGTIIYTPTGPQEIMGDVLKDTVNIPPTVIKHNGDRIQVLAARDVDFSHVYELDHVDTRH